MAWIPSLFLSATYLNENVQRRLKRLEIWEKCEHTKLHFLLWLIECFVRLNEDRHSLGLK